MSNVEWRIANEREEGGLSGLNVDATVGREGGIRKGFLEEGMREGILARAGERLVLLAGWKPGVQWGTVFFNSLYTVAGHDQCSARGDV
jgi:hypothetical protein